MLQSHCLNSLCGSLRETHTHITAVFSFFLSTNHMTSQAEATRPDALLVLVNGVGSLWGRGGGSFTHPV